jgi:DNA-binding transcriptional MerR regulator
VARRGTGERWRAVDVAATAGISVQQVRNYVDLGVLPAVARTPSGYRIFTGEHVAALAVVRQMAAGHGWARTRTIMGAVHEGEMATAIANVDASHAELDRERAEVGDVLNALTTVTAGPAPTQAAPVPRSGLRIGEVARIARARPPVLRLWERRGLLRPAREPGTGYRVYDEAELRTARVVALLRRGAYPFPVVHAVVDALRGGSPDQVRTELAKREQELHRRSVQRLRASAALYGYLDEYGHLEQHGQVPRT